ncbi:YdcF family protein [Rhizobiaceae bacterium n13]|uniref:YdcF family protein n=1 Tax=Ferirhizobium litorale TaxID=2927786 RepID=A0AAE3QGK9_9HYPH|nr:YdcF family protein [Fererhizobium litorale]MDI7862601.1 YdcF family protein [Fererhizobium litorale]MDI7923565.1 YdcF family protein [Fererhizobium litorale]
MMLRRSDSLASPSARDGWLSRRGPIRRFARLCALLMLILFAVVFAGFLWFADSVASMHPPEKAKADAIVVLTGGYQRIEQAVSLLENGAGGRLLISGVHPSTTPSQIRKMTQGSQVLFSCCVDIGYEALDTIGNANETVRWIHDKGYRNILVVTNNYHMPRSLLELRRLDPTTSFIPYPVVNSDLKRKNWFVDPNALRMLLSEYGKILITSVRDYTGLHKTTGLRAEKAAVASVHEVP